MIWSDRGRPSGVKKAVFAERVPTKKAVPGWLHDNQKQGASRNAFRAKPESCAPPPPAPRAPTVPPPTLSSPPPTEVAAVDSLASALPTVETTSERSDAEMAGGAPGGAPSEFDAALQARLEQTTEALERSIEQLAALRQTLEPEVEEQLVRLATTIARRVIGRELSLDPQVVTTLVREGIDALGERDRVVVRIGPLDDAVVDSMSERLRQTVPHCEIIVDPAFVPGQCLVRSEFGQVDESIETRIGTLLEVLTASEEPRSP